MRCLCLRFEAPLMAFGGEAVDARGVIVDFPAASMLTGLIASALGWHRGEWQRHARLQERLVFGVRVDRAGQRLTDFQTVKLGSGDRAWTTRGVVEGRAGGAATYDSPHIRRRDYDADKSLAVALYLRDDAEPPSLDAVAQALAEPARPLFLGRKSCAPATPLYAGIVEAASLTAALTPPSGCEPSERQTAARLMLPASEAAQPQDESRTVTDERNWRSGVHGGARLVRIRTLSDAKATP